MSTQALLFNLPFLDLRIGDKVLYKGMDAIVKGFEPLTSYIHCIPDYNNLVNKKSIVIVRAYLDFGDGAYAPVPVNELKSY